MDGATEYGRVGMDSRVDVEAKSSANSSLVLLAEDLRSDGKCAPEEDINGTVSAIMAAFRDSWKWSKEAMLICLDRPAAKLSYA